jgi:hypothetical protein
MIVMYPMIAKPAAIKERMQSTVSKVGLLAGAPAAFCCSISVLVLKVIS